MKKTIAIVAGGDSSEHDVSLRSAEGIYSWIDKEKFNVYTIEIKGLTWEAHLPDGTKTPVNRHDFTFVEGGKTVKKAVKSRASRLRIPFWYAFGKII